MPRQPLALDALDVAIKQHLRDHGSKNWRPLHHNFPEVSARTFWRHVAAAKSPPPDKSPDATEEFPSLAAAHTESEDLDRSIALIIYYMLKPKALFDLHRDAMALRAIAVGPDGVITDTAIFERAMAARLNAFKVSLGFSLKMTRLHDVFEPVVMLIDELGKTDPDVLIPIIKLLQQRYAPQNQGARYRS